MKWHAEIKAPRHLRCTIAYEPLRNIASDEVIDGYYLYVYEGNSTRSVWDDLQDTFEIAKEVAYEEFGVPLDAWVKVA